MSYREDYRSLASEYLDPDSLMYQKVRLVDTYINRGDSLLDAGMGTGELIALVRPKFKQILGIDNDARSLEICRKRFANCQGVNLLEGDLLGIAASLKPAAYECITCLDILEHLELEDCRAALVIIKNLLADGGRFIFTGPGVFDKIRIRFGWSHHLHSHSSFGWKRLINEVGFRVDSVETVRFPFWHRDFLRKRLHLLGECCLIVASKEPRPRQGGRP